MRLHSPEFQKRLERLVKAEVKRSPALRKQRRQAPKRRDQRAVAGVFRGLISLGAWTLVFSSTMSTGHLLTGLAALALWNLAWVLIRAGTLRATFYGDAQIMVLLAYPISDEALWKWQAQKYFRRSLFTLVDQILGLAAIALALKFNGRQWLAVLPLAVLSWAAVQSLAALCVTRLPAGVYTVPAAFMTVGVVFLVYGIRLFGSEALEMLDRAGPTLVTYLPTGWPIAVLGLLDRSESWVAAILLVPTGLTLWTWPDSWRRLRAAFRFFEHVRPVPSDVLPPGEPEAAGKTETEERQPGEQTRARVGPSEIEEVILTRRFLAVAAWDQSGAVERWLWRWLTPRERALCDFAHPAGLRITKPWLKIFRNLAIGLAAGYVAGRVKSETDFMVWIATGVVTGIQALASLNSGRTFRAVLVGGEAIPIHATLGIGFRETARLSTKCAVAQAPGFFVLTLAWGMLIALLGGWSPAAAIVTAFKMAGLSCAAKWLLVVFRFSGGSSDTKEIRPRNIGPMFIIVGMAIFFLLAGGAAVVVPDVFGGWVCWVLAVADAYLLLRFYGWWFNRNKFDLASRIVRRG